MRKLVTWLMLLSLLMSATIGAYAEGPFVMAGYDHEDTRHDWQSNLFFARMEDLTGVELVLRQFTDSNTWKDAKELMLQEGADLPDVLFKADLTPDETLALYEAGVLIDLKPYLRDNCPNLMALLDENPEWLTDITLPDGAIVALPALDELQFNNAMWINKDWLTAVGMKAPTTAEEFTEVLRAFKKYDANLNGDPNDEIPLTFMSMWDLRFLGHAFGINANDYYMTVKDGVVCETLTTDQNRAFLTWLNQLWSEGLLDLNGFSGLRDMALSASSSDQDEPLVYGVMMAPSPATLVPGDKLATYQILMPLVYEGKQVYRDLPGDVVRGTFAITSKCQDPAAMLRWVDYLYTDEGFMLSEAGMAGVEYEWNDDGTWLWLDTSENLTTRVLPEATIRTGTSMPGIASVAYQQKIDSADTRMVIGELLGLKAIDSLPYPLVDLTKEQQERIDALQLDIAGYAEQMMVWFVVGDKPLNDATWAEFCQQVKELGIEEEVAIWQSALDARMKK